MPPNPVPADNSASASSGSAGNVPAPTPRAAPNWMAQETPAPWNYQPVYPSRHACAAGEGLVFDVGAGRAYPTLKDVPWQSLIPCDVVNIHYQSAPYRDIIFLSVRGAADKWITIRGVAGPNGEMPVLDGSNAVMPRTTGANAYSDSNGMIIVKRPANRTLASLYKPGYLHITGLKITNARPPHKVTNLAGDTVTWSPFGAGIYVNGAEKIAITHCDLGGNGLGLFANSTGDEILQTRHLLIAHNYFHDNSNPGSFSEHNAYTEAIGTTYEYNYFGPILANSNGDNIKDRSAGIIFRNNRVEGGQDLLALRDPESNVDFESAQLDAWGEKLVAAAFVYSNIFVTKSYVQAVVGHGDGGMGTGKQPREGRLYFYANRVVSQVDNVGYWQNNIYYPTQGVPLFDLLNTRSPTTVVARNNLLFAGSKTVGGTPAPMALFYWQGLADFEANWVNQFVKVYSNVGGTNLATGTQFNGAGLGGLANSNGSPGFVDFANGNYLTTPGSPFAGLAAAYPSGITKRGLVPTADPVTTAAQALAP